MSWHVWCRWMGARTCLVARGSSWGGLETGTRTDSCRDLFSLGRVQGRVVGQRPVRCRGPVWEIHIYILISKTRLWWWDLWCISTLHWLIKGLGPAGLRWRRPARPEPGVSIIFKIRVFYKARFEGFDFFIRWPYAVFHKMLVVFYKSAHFMYLWGVNSVFAKCALQSSKILK